MGHLETLSSSGLAPGRKEFEAGFIYLSGSILPLFMYSLFLYPLSLRLSIFPHFFYLPL